MKQAIALFVLCSAVSARAEFGVSAGASFNFKADFRNAARTQGSLSSPDTAGNRTYDDGYVRSDNIPGYPDQTRYYGYDTADGADISVPGELTLHSSQTIIDAQEASGEQSEGQPAIEIYWKENLTDNEKFNVGLRAAFRWQHIELDSTSLSTTTTRTESHTYLYSSGALLTGSYDGYPTPTPGYPVIGDTPTTETVSYTVGESLVVFREIKADIFGFDLGPTLSFDLAEKLSLTASAGGTVAWIQSDFSYEQGAYSSGSDRDEDWLCGAYVSADLQYKLGERWGIFGGVAYVRLEDFEQEVDGMVSELQSDDSYTLRCGLFFE